MQKMEHYFVIRHSHNDLPGGAVCWYPMDHRENKQRSFVGNIIMLQQLFQVCFGCTEKKASRSFLVIMHGFLPCPLTDVDLTSSYIEKVA